MKKVSIALSALAVAATVSTAMAHTSKTATPYCVATDSAGVTLTFTVNEPKDCPNQKQVFGQTNPQTITRYGYIRINNEPCTRATCPPVLFTQEP